MVNQWNLIQFGLIKGIDSKFPFPPSFYHSASFENFQVVIDGRGRDLESLHDFTQTDILDEQHANNLEPCLVPESLMKEG